MNHKPMLPFYIALFFQFVTSIFVLWFAYLYFIPVRVIVPNEQPYKVKTKQVRIGEQLVYVVDACKYKDVAATVARAFVEDSRQSIYPAISEVSRLKTGCGKTDVFMTVPPSVLPGKYYLQLDITYQVNFLREENYHFETETFEILPMKEKI